MGRSTCASVSALSFDAQPAQLERLVKRIWRPVGLGSNIISFDQGIVVPVSGNGKMKGESLGKNITSTFGESLSIYR